MFRFTLIAVTITGASGVAIPAPPEPAAQVLVAQLSDPSEEVRDRASAALKGRADARPWLRRAARARAPITAARALLLLEPLDKARQRAVARAIDACLRDDRIDLLAEWYQFWQPENKDDLWAVGARAVNRAAKPGAALLAKACRPVIWERHERGLASFDDIDPKTCRSHDGPCPANFEAVDGAWSIRTDRFLHQPNFVRFAVADRAALGVRNWGQFLVLGPTVAHSLDNVFLACDGSVGYRVAKRKGMAPEPGVTTLSTVVVCRGNFTGAIVSDSVLLADGDIDLTRSEPRHCLIRATGEIRLPKGFTPEACTIEAHKKNATAPYAFFEPADVGLALADDEEGLLVTAVKPGTPFGDCGIRSGDIVRAIDDVPAGDAEEFRRKLRRALVRQGDCLITVMRDRAIDLPVFFPHPN